MIEPFWTLAESNIISIWKLFSKPNFYSQSFFLWTRNSFNFMIELLKRHHGRNLHLSFMTSMLTAQTKEIDLHLLGNVDEPLKKEMFPNRNKSWIKLKVEVTSNTRTNANKKEKTHLFIVCCWWFYFNAFFNFYQKKILHRYLKHTFLELNFKRFIFCLCRLFCHPLLWLLGCELYGLSSKFGQYHRL